MKLSRIIKESKFRVNKEISFFLYSGSHDDYEYMRKFSSNDDSINHSSPTSSFQYPVYSQLDKNGKKIKFAKVILVFFINFLNNLDYIMDDYYALNRPNMTAANVNYNNNVITNKNNLNLLVTSNEEIRVPVVRVVKRRTTANKKERRRTQSINSAYSSLREHIPNVPSDTKLSKVRVSFRSFLEGSSHPIIDINRLTNFIIYLSLDQNTSISDIIHKLLN